MSPTPGGFRDAPLEPAQQRELSDFASSLPIAIYRYRAEEDGAARVLFVSDQIQALWGVSPATFMGDPAARFARLHPDDREAVQEADQQALRDREDFSRDFRVSSPGELAVAARAREPTPDGGRQRRLPRLHRGHHPAQAGGGGAARER